MLLSNITIVSSARTNPIVASGRVNIYVSTANHYITAFTLTGVPEKWKIEQNPFQIQGERNLAAAADDYEKLVGSFFTELYDTQGHRLGWEETKPFEVWQSPGDHTHYLYEYQSELSEGWTLELGDITVIWHVTANWVRYTWENNNWVLNGQGHLEDQLSSDMKVEYKQDT
jgi:hypothetical protein